MRVVLLLCRLRSCTMAWSGSVFDYLWRRLGLLWRCVTRMCVRVLRFSARLALPWREEHGNEPEVSDENTGPGSPARGSPDDDEALLCEGQYEAAGGKRAAVFDGEAFCKRPKLEEGEDEEEDDEDYRVETMDELYCGYDSTWETEQNEKNISRRSRPPAASRYYKFNRFESAARDMQNYRHGYPNQVRMQHWKKQAPDDKPNLNFYLGLTPSLPDGVYITDFHEEWYGEYDTLEYVHTYIQWLFPLQEPGMNYAASPLTKEEVQDFRENSTAKKNLLTSYELMLDFYGIELCDWETGRVKRADNWRDRFNNLNSHTHNNLRITRILKCLGTLGYQHYQAPLVRFFLEETLVNGELPSVKDSVLNYFLFAVLDKEERRNLIKFAYSKYDRKDEFVWCPKKIQMLWSGPSTLQKQTNDEKGARDSDPSLEYLSLDSEAPDKAKEAAKSECVSYM